MTCEDFEQKADTLWEQWVLSSDTDDPELWDKACESYINAMEELRQSYGHPPRRPRQRPH